MLSNKFGLKISLKYKKFFEEKIDTGSDSGHYLKRYRIEICVI